MGTVKLHLWTAVFRKKEGLFLGDTRFWRSFPYIYTPPFQFWRSYSSKPWDFFRECGYVSPPLANAEKGIVVAATTKVSLT